MSTKQKNQLTEISVIDIFLKYYYKNQAATSFLKLTNPAIIFHVLL